MALTASALVAVGCNLVPGDSNEWGAEFGTVWETRLDDLFEIPERLIAAEPDLRLGESDGAPLLFHRVDGIQVLEDGSLVIADVGDSRLYHVSPKGQLRQEFGAPGFGPGEFRRISGMVPMSPHSLLTFDSALLRLSLFDLDGTVLKTVRIERPDGSVSDLDGYSLADALEDGSVILVPQRRVVRSSLRQGVRRERRPVLRFSSEGRFLTNLGVWQEVEIWEGDRVSINIPHGDHVSVAAGHGLVVETAHQRGRVRIWSWDGSRQDFTLEFQKRPMHPSVREQWIASYTDPIPERDQRRQAEALLRQVPFPESVPYLDKVSVGRDGSVWFAVPNPTQADGVVTWVRIGLDGRPTERVKLPDGLRLEVIDDQQVVGIWRDSLGVQSVRRYRWAEVP